MIAAFIAFIISSNSWAGVPKQIQNTQEEMTSQDRKQQQVVAALFKINRNLQTLVINKTQLQNQKNLAQLEAIDLNKKIGTQKHQIELQKAQLTERLRAIYKLRGPSLFRFLLSVKTSSDFDRSLKILGIVAQRDFQLIRGYQKEVRDLEYRREKLAKKIQSLKTLELAQQEHESKLEAEFGKKNRILEGLRKSQLFSQEKLDKLKVRTPQYDLADSGILDMVSKPSFELQRGQLPKPVQGLVLNSFGLIRPGDQPYVLSNKGVLISAPPGSPVHAVYKGVVSFVGSLPGLGQVLILDHGDHYYTVYGNNADVRVEVGQEVLQSQVVGSSGRSSFEQKDGLYFEVRHFSEPYNPMEWVKGLSL